jgi:hypothetical protein
MKFFDPNNPNEKKKMIAAGALGLVALVVLGYVFFGGSSSRPVANNNRPSPTPKTIITQEVGQPQGGDENSNLTPIVYYPPAPPSSEANRNIFAYYIPPSPTPTPLPSLPTPTPTPTPPLTASALSPSVVTARTPGDFSLQVTGDKFTPAVKIVIDGREMPTRFISAQQLFTTVPASFITSPGVRDVIVRTSDSRLYSNRITLNVTPAPEPNYNYVGLIGKPRFNDTAILQDKTSKELLNVQRGDPVGARFRVVSISEKEIKLIEVTLKIPYTISLSKDQNSNSPYRPPTRSVDDEP